jgi:hypothetical protein
MGSVWARPYPWPNRAHKPIQCSCDLDSTTRQHSRSICFPYPLAFFSLTPAGGGREGRRPAAATHLRFLGSETITAKGWGVRTPPRHSSSLGSRHSSSLGSSRQRRPFRTALRHRVRRPRVYAGARPPPLLPHLLLKVVFSLFPFSSSHSLGFMFLDARVAADDGSRIIFEWRMILHLSAVNPLPLANPRYRIPR